MKKSRRFGLISRVLRWASPLHLLRTELTTKPYGSVDTYLTRVQPLALLKAIFGPQTASLTREWPWPYCPSGCGRRSRWDSSLQLQSSCQPDSCSPKPVLVLWPKQTRDFNLLPLPPTFVHWKFILWKNNNKTTWVSCKGNKETLCKDRTIPATYLWIIVFADCVSWLWVWLLWVMCYAWVMCLLGMWKILGAPQDQLLLVSECHGTLYRGGESILRDESRGIVVCLLPAWWCCIGGVGGFSGGSCGFWCGQQCRWIGWARGPVFPIVMVCGCGRWSRTKRSWLQLTSFYWHWGKLLLVCGCGGPYRVGTWLGWIWIGWCWVSSLVGVQLVVFCLKREVP